jgi:CRISPR-associated endonuclease/helicase Cas3
MATESRRLSGTRRAGVLVAVREALERLAPGADRVVHVAELRGGIARDEVWAKRPDLPLLAASTVDQVGSRLLFRGYGVGRNSASIHAGLLGQDTLLLLDEVHLSEPFRQTLEAIGAYYRSWPPTQAEANRPANRAETKPNRAETKHSLPDRWKVVEMSATPGKIAADRFGLAPPDRNNPVLAARLDASKPARLCSVKVKGDDAAARATPRGGPREGDGGALDCRAPADRGRGQPGGHRQADRRGAPGAGTGST